MFTTLDAVLNEHDIFDIDNKLTWGEDCEQDLREINRYLERGAKLGAWWGGLRAVEVRLGADEELEVRWNKDM